MNSEDSAPNHVFGATSGGTDWQEYYYAIRKRLWIVILCLVLGAISAAIFMNGQHRAFQARSVLFIEQEQSQVTNLKGVGEDKIISVDMINTIVDLLKSYGFAERVATRLKLADDPRFTKVLAEKAATKLTPEEVAGVLASHVTASYRLKTRLIDIFVTHPDASLAKDLANAYADEYLRYGYDRRAEANRAANQYLIDEVERLKRLVHSSEEAMQSFREKIGGNTLESLELAAEGKVGESSKTITEIENKLFQLDNDLKVVSSNPNDAATLLRLPSVATQPKVAEINQQIADTDRQFTLIKQHYRAKHPSFIAAQTQMDSLRRNRDRVLQDVVGLLKGERQRLQAQYEELKNVKNSQQASLLDMTRLSLEYNDLKRDLDSNRTMFNNVAGRKAEIDVTKGMTDFQVRIHEKAIGATPVMASTPKVYSVGTLLGLVAGLGIALGIHFLDHSVKTVDQAEHLAGVPVLAAVPKKANSNARTLDVVAEREGIIAESFRSLRTTLAMAAHADERRVFLFTSALPSEGKTFCSSNFAATLSQQGFKTLLMDGDLRRPMTSKVFFGGQRMAGLSEILTGEVEFGGAVFSTKVENLDVLPAGVRVPNPAELLASPRLKDIFQQALLVYDRVVIDTAPILAVSDSLLIAPHADVTCVVLRLFKTPSKTFLRALKSLEEINSRPAGIVLNFMPSGAGNYYYYSGKYHAAYGEKGVYGAF